MFKQYARCCMRSVKAIVIAFFFGALAMGAFGIALAAPTEAPPAPGTVPPLQPFVMKVSPQAVGPNQTVEYQITLRNTTWSTYTGALIGITNTLPTEVIAFAPIQASKGVASLVNSQEITWSGELGYQEQLTITYGAELARNIVTSTLVSTATLWENQGPTTWPTATHEVLVTTATLAVKTYWPIYLASVNNPLPSLLVIKNGTFELGSNGAWAESSKIIFSKSESPLILPPYRGAPNQYYAWLGGEYNAKNVLAQDVTVPKGYTSVKLIFDAWVQSDEDQCGSDVARVILGGTELTSLSLCKSTNSVVNPNTGGWATQMVPLTNLAAIEGKSAQFAFQVTTNGAKNSNWYIDNVRLCSTDPLAAADDRCPAQ
jgi:uncharacterized repeat protein (TIGR01451 family)